MNTEKKSPGGPVAIGLSTDLYFPPLDQLTATLSASLDEFRQPLDPDYIELFRGRTVDLKHAREHLVSREIPLRYHGDALWYTQPEFQAHPATGQEIRRANGHMDALESSWMIHECAHKSLGGRTFGTYLPPLFTDSSADLIRDNALWLKDRLNHRQLIVEIPPVPFFLPGPLDPGRFFTRILNETELGLGLDLGHLLTMMEALGRKTDPDSYALWLADSFPLDHVVEIHVGGMGCSRETPLPFLFDDHPSPVPDRLFELLEAVLKQCPMAHLEGVALEVDNKETDRIIDEFRRFKKTITGALSRPAPLSLSPRESPAPTGSLSREETVALVSDQYTSLSAYLSGHTDDTPEGMHGYPAVYRRSQYPFEVWTFGGEIPALFPRTIALIEPLFPDLPGAFVRYFHRDCLSEVLPFDYLVFKVLKFQEWIKELSVTGFLPPDTALLAREASRAEADQILADQEWINGDPV